MRDSLNRSLLLVGALVVSLALPQLAAAQPAPGVEKSSVLGAPAGPPLSGDALDALTEEVAGVMRCPVCQGLSVADSPADAAVNMKNEVKDLLALGYSGDQVISYFVQAYGEFIQLAPEKKGFNLVVWVAPFAAFFLGLVLILWRIGESGKDEEEGEATDEELLPYLERVRREVAS